MKAIYIDEPGKVSIREIEKPVRKENEALLRVLCGGICGSDLGSYRGTFAYFDYPRIPGHEFAAEIVEIDPNDRGLRPGMIVTCNPYFNCGHCASCKKGLVNACMDNQTMGCQRDGAFCEFITMPVERIYDGKGLSPKVLAAIEPFCISAHGVKKAQVKEGEKVLVMGSGTIGVLSGVMAKQAGAEVTLCDIPPAKEKLDYALKSFGFAGTILNEGPDYLEQSVKEITGTEKIGGEEVGVGFDVCIEAVGLPSTFLDCINCAAYGGRVVQIGVGKKNADFNFTLLQKKELSVFGSRNAEKEDFLTLIDLVKEGKVNLEKIITDVYPFSEAARAFSDLSERGGAMLKTEIDFSELYTL